MPKFSISQKNNLIEAEQAAKANFADVRMRIEMINLKFACSVLLQLAPKFLQINA